MYGTTSARIRYSTRCLETRVTHTFHVCGLRVVVFFHRTQGNALVEMSQGTSLKCPSRHDVLRMPHVVRRCHSLVLSSSALGNKPRHMTWTISRKRTRLRSTPLFCFSAGAPVGTRPDSCGDVFRRREYEPHRSYEIPAICARRKKQGGQIPHGWLRLRFRKGFDFDVCVWAAEVKKKKATRERVRGGCMTNLIALYSIRAAAFTRVV
ncbi:hypothetical protein HD554DRAFT_2036260 [Boletus coccyginus]|nr:hypothetical protein HD554DRAFT_2036260 [Boletus coccyginus]